MQKQLDCDDPGCEVTNDFEVPANEVPPGLVVEGESVEHADTTAVAEPVQRIGMRMTIRKQTGKWSRFPNQSAPSLQVSRSPARSMASDGRLPVGCGNRINDRSGQTFSPCQSAFLHVRVGLRAVRYIFEANRFPEPAFAGLLRN